MGVNMSMIALMAMVPGCSAAAQYEAAHEALRGNPALRRVTIDQCYKGASQVSPQLKTDWAKFMMLSPRKDVALTFCTRAVDGVASGRLTLDDVRSARRGSPTAQFVKVFQGR